MKPLLQILSSLLFDAVQKSFGSVLDLATFQIELTQASNAQFGHYQSNVAMHAAKILGKNPRDVAVTIVAGLSRSSDDGIMIIEKVDIAGPGFINITLDSGFLSAFVSQQLKDQHLGIEKPLKIQKIVVDFSSPNVAKELHVGHLRSTIIGDCLARLFEFLGHNVLRLNHIGDWGTQFGMLIAYLKKYEPQALSDDRAQMADSSGDELQQASLKLSSLMVWYKASKKKFDEDDQFKTEAREEVVRLQAGDVQSLAMWNKICDISRAAYQHIYQLLDVTIIDRGESFYNPYLNHVVALLDERGILQTSQGAQCVFLDGFVGKEGEPLPMIIKKSDGGFNYATTDMAALRHRIEVEQADRIIYVTDAGQRMHFEMLEQAAVKAGILDPKKVQFDHVMFGLVLGPDGKKFKTRSGETEPLIDLLEEAVVHAKAALAERIKDTTETELTGMARILGIDAVKYADLSTQIQKDYMFSYERMLKFEGNTAAYLLYCYVRICSIKRKIGKDINCLLSAGIKLEHPSEIALGLHLAQFDQTLDGMSRTLLPSRLTDYLYTLAEKFHAFFHDCRVEGTEQETSRLLLCQLTGRVLKQGLEIVGLKTLERM